MSPARPATPYIITIKKLNLTKKNTTVVHHNNKYRFVVVVR